MNRLGRLFILDLSLIPICAWLVTRVLGLERSADAGVVAAVFACSAGAMALDACCIRGVRWAVYARATLTALVLAAVSRHGAALLVAALSQLPVLVACLLAMRCSPEPRG